MTNPKVSVIIPNYNHARYLDQRIQSVLNQTYQDFEVIILDDCSPDNGASKAVIEKYRSNPHISHIVYNEVNSGSTFKQWEKGIELAKGEIIWIAESDDWCELNFLEMLMPCWEKYPDCSVIESALWYVDKNGNKHHPNRVFNNKIVHENGIDFIKTRLVQSNFYIPNSSAVTFRKDIALAVPKDYMDYKAAGDRLFWIYMLERGNICIVNTPLSYFRQHEVKVTQKKERDGTQARENHKINSYLHKRGFIKGIISVEEFLFYWSYLTRTDFESEELREELINIWFPWWKRNKMYRVFVYLYYFLYGKLYKLKHYIWK